MKIVTTETLPPEKSMSGINSVYLHCTNANKRRSYGVCLFTIRASEMGKLNETNECKGCIENGTCDALKYRQEERDAGRALYYLPRTDYGLVEARPLAPQKPIKSSLWPKKVTKPNNPVEVKASPVKTESVKQKQTSKLFGTATSELSEAVNEAVKQDAGKTTKSAKIKSGMSLLDRAKAMRAARG